MKQTIKKYIESSAKSMGLIGLGLALAAGTAVLAYTAPTGQAPSGNVPAPINTGAVAQTKTGALTVKDNINSTGGDGYGISSLGYVIGKDAIFTRSFQAGVHGGLLQMVLQKGLKIDTNGDVSVTGPGTDPNTPMFKIRTGGTTLTNLFEARSDSGAFSVQSKGQSSDSFGNNGRTVARVDGNLDVSDQVRIGGGSPKANSILVSTDSNGTATWATQDSSGTKSLIYISRYSRIAQPEVTISCDAGDFAIGGGGTCDYGIKSSEPVRINPGTGGYSVGGDGTNLAPLNGWRVNCLSSTTANAGTVGLGGTNGGNVRAEVICMKNTQFVTNIAVAQAQSPIIPPVTGSWHLVNTVGSTVPGNSTCATWAGVSQADASTKISAADDANCKAAGTGGKLGFCGGVLVGQGGSLVTTFSPNMSPNDIGATLNNSTVYLGNPTQSGKSAFTCKYY